MSAEAKGVLRRNEKIGRESYRPNDRIRCYIKDVRREARGPQIFLSPHGAGIHVEELFKMEVPEIYDGIIEIKACCSRSGKLAPRSPSFPMTAPLTRLAPVSVCAAVACRRWLTSLQGEKIDIIPWNEDHADFPGECALQPAEVSKVVLDEEAEQDRGCRS